MSSAVSIPLIKDITIIMKHLVTYRPQIRTGLALLVVAAVVAIFTVCVQRAYGYDQDIARLNRFMQNKGNTASMQIFREGRDFIEAQNWQRAAEKFNDFITAYPKDKDLDAALYWYGYALQKQDRKEEAAVPLLRKASLLLGASISRHPKKALPQQPSSRCLTVRRTLPARSALTPG